MKALFARLRWHMPTLTGAALLTLVADGFILVYRLVGLTRPVAVYAGLLTLLVLGTLFARRVFVPKSTAVMKAKPDAEENTASTVRPREQA